MTKRRGKGEGWTTHGPVRSCKQHNDVSTQKVFLYHKRYWVSFLRIIESNKPLSADPGLFFYTYEGSKRREEVKKEDNTNRVLILLSPKQKLLQLDNRMESPSFSIPTCPGSREDNSGGESTVTTSIRLRHIGI